MPPKPDQVLPQKENTLFKQLLRCYETKQYKKGLKTADTILKKCPENGETLAMKGLTLNCMDKKKEAEELVKLGLRYNMTSHICWHVYGLLHRSEHRYKEAINCYQQALKREQDNSQILRDLSLLQIQTRDTHGFLESKRTLLNQNAKLRNNWIGFAVANHLCGDIPSTRKVLAAYESTIDVPSKADVEHSEFLLYKNTVIYESGDVETALKNLEEIDRLVLDKITLAENKAKYLMELGRRDEAGEAYLSLLGGNSENYEYHRGLMAARGVPFPLYRRNEAAVTLTTEQTAALMAEYRLLREKFPRSAACKRIPLDALKGDELRAELDVYIRPLLRKGMPSLFASLESLYRREENVAVIEGLLIAYLESLKAALKLPLLAGETEAPLESPDMLLWTLYFAALHYSKLGQTPRALATIDEAINHTPTLIDVYTTKARILSHAGAYSEASDLCEIARQMDTADRYLNTLSVKAALKADKVELAESVVQLFTKDGENPNNLNEMQAMWYETRYAYACMRTAQYGKALKKLTQVEKHFEDIVEDQMDFHNYCLRKMTIRAYFAMMKLEDTIYGNRRYVKAAMGCVRTYLMIFDKPTQAQLDEMDEELMGKTDAQKKAILAKRKKGEQKKAAAAAAERSETKGKKRRTQDNDPDGAALAAVFDPLSASLPYLAKLEKFAKDNVEVHLLACDVWTKRQRPLRVLQSAIRAYRLDKESGEVVLRIVRLLNLVASLRETLPEQVVSVLDSQIASSFAPLPVAGGAEAVSRHLLTLEPTLANRFSAAQATLELQPSATAEAVKLLSDPSLKIASSGHAVLAHSSLAKDVHRATSVYRWMMSNKMGEAAAALKQRFHTQFPHADAFRPAAAAASAAV